MVRLKQVDAVTSKFSLVASKVEELEDDHKPRSRQVSCCSTDTGFLSCPCSEIDFMATSAALESIVEDTLKAIVDECDFCVTIADPRKPDIPLIAVSDRFEAMSGFSRHEVVGKNCRFLNHGCSLETAEIAALRRTCETGAPFTAVVENRRKSGEKFMNLLDLRGLTIAHNTSSNEELWFLVGIQSDVTNLCESEIPESNLAALHKVANAIRMRLTHALGYMAVHEAEGCSVDRFSGPSVTWTFLSDLQWRDSSASSAMEADEIASPCSRSDSKNLESGQHLSKGSMAVILFAAVSLCASFSLLRVSRAK